MYVLISLPLLGWKRYLLQKRLKAKTMKKYYAESELIINPDGSIFHLHIKPEQLADKVILVGDPGRVALVASHFDTKECEVESREFRLSLKPLPELIKVNVLQ